MIAGWLVRRVRAVALAAVGLFTLVVTISAGSDAQGTATLDPTELRALALQATLRVEARSCDGSVRGSGVVVDGNLITNRHVVERAHQAKVDGPIASALVSVTAVSDTLDLAIVDAPPAINVELADEPATIGDTVLLAGHAAGGPTQLVDARITLRVDGATYGHQGELYLIDGVTSEGFSGGPVLDDRGRLVGVLTGFDSATQLSLAIPVDLLRSELEIVAQSPASAADGLTSDVTRPIVCG